MKSGKRFLFYSLIVFVAVSGVTLFTRPRSVDETNSQLSDVASTVEPIDFLDLEVSHDSSTNEIVIVTEPGFAACGQYTMETELFVEGDTVEIDVLGAIWDSQGDDCSEIVDVLLELEGRVPLSDLTVNSATEFRVSNEDDYVVFNLRNPETEQTTIELETTGRITAI